MNYILENEFIKVEISDLGAELQSIYGKKSKFEYLWQADVEGLWKRRAIVLFPICGRLYKGKYTYNGTEYEMTLHGFARSSTFSVNNKTNERIVFELTENEETLKVYPFSFNFKVIYTLSGASVRTEFVVKNVGDKDLPFSVGGHPGFNIPFDKNVLFEEHYAEFDSAEKRDKLVMSENYLFDYYDTNYKLKDDKILELKHELFDDDAIFLKTKSGAVTLKSNKSDKFVKVVYEDMTHVGFWHNVKTQANFVCIEPWHGVPATDGVVDDLSTKKELIHLKENEEYSTYFDICVSE